jgi:hypothetical protein
LRWQTPGLDRVGRECSGVAMGRSLPKLIVLLAIAAVVAAIMVVSRRSPPPQSGIVYVNPNAGTANAPAPAVAP